MVSMFDLTRKHDTNLTRVSGCRYNNFYNSLIDGTNYFCQVVDESNVFGCGILPFL